MNERRRRRLSRLAVPLIAVAAIVCSAALPTSAGPDGRDGPGAAEGRGHQRIVENPGRFSGTALPGSFYEYLDVEGNPIDVSYFDVGNPACDDDVDDDLDGFVDVGNDPECDSETDANERLDGVQEFVPAVLPLKIKPNGVITVRPRDLVVTPREKCIDYGNAVNCMLIAPRGTGPARRGSVTADGTITIPIPLIIDIDDVTGFPGLDCQIGYTENLYTATDYDEGTGEATFETGPDNPAPATTGCGEYAEILDSALSLPGTGHSVLVVQTLDAEGDPIDLAG